MKKNIYTTQKTKTGQLVSQVVISNALSTFDRTLAISAAAGHALTSVKKREERKKKNSNPLPRNLPANFALLG